MFSGTPIVQSPTTAKELMNGLILEVSKKAGIDAGHLQALPEGYAQGAGPGEVVYWLAMTTRRDRSRVWLISLYDRV